ncbi:MBL fold metallo-hydrolase [Desulfolutivibrio sulfoxidireducens]|uniref:MBL fold metallo-hydrolase n=1 Tax=Desulfolutivibrio sulfoxidireducens TaxID=2773299 RepID=UPI00159DCFE8|nr:MBL fold metallo-hydrolase [Desulfolutivibrio sulfoxidireducens]QLA16945.1 MBL fold metallo-hydrolase [Desulfolutivibrio sulfoxidireducens]QLA20511.1 MBL fold metallo-hydrolase [Desulfolutivibrio sulfoxidireducens]
MDITYIHHNCFVLRHAGRVLLFDYPSPNHLPPQAAAVAAPLLAGADLLVFFSHSHPDHFDPDILAVTAAAASRRFVVSDDVADMFPDSLPPDAVVMEPDQTRNVEGLSVGTLESNDLGVAYLIASPEKRIYFGGDLAQWDWPTLPDHAREETRRFFDAALARIAPFRPDVAFTNCDPRLDSLGGVVRFARAVRPGLLIPMHLFGDASGLWTLPSRIAEDDPADEGISLPVFCYERPGDAAAMALNGIAFRPATVEEERPPAARGETF